MPAVTLSQRDLIRQAAARSLAARTRYVEQVVVALTEDLAAARAQVGAAILRIKSLGSVPDGKLAGLKGLERLDADLRGIMADLRRRHTVRCRTETKAAFRMGIADGLAEFADAQLPVYRDLTPEGLDKLATAAFQLVDTDALDFLAGYTTTLAGEVSRETTDGIMRVVRTAIATGKGTDDIVRDLGEVVTDRESFRHAGSKVFSKAQYRMEVIARTEVLRAHNLGKLKFHQAVGIQRLEWFTMGDERMCPVCGALDGKQYPADEFPQQPAHPQCRCGHYPAWPLIVCGQGPLAASAACVWPVLSATAAPGQAEACILPPQAIEAAAAAQAAEAKALKATFESGDPAHLATLTLKQVQTLAKQQGVAVARTKADFLTLLAAKGIDGTGLSGQTLAAVLKANGIGALRSKDELIALLVQKQAALVQAKLQAQLLQEAAQTGQGLEAMTVKELQGLAQTKGISLNMTKADVLALLDQLEPGSDHSDLAGATLAAAKAKYHIGPLKNKSQLIAALQQVAGQQMAQQAVEDAQQAAVAAAVTALKEAAGQVVLPTGPQGYAPFLEQLTAAQQALANSPTVPQDLLQQIAGELAAKQAAVTQQLLGMGASDVQKIAQAAKVPKYQWASKGELIALLTETDATKVAPVTQSVQAKWAKWAAQQQAKKTGAVAAKAQQEAHAAAQAASAQAKALLQAKAAAVVAPTHPDDLAAHVAAVQALQAALQTHGAHLSADELAHYGGVVETLQGWGTNYLQGLKVTELKALAKAQHLPNWAFATKDQLVTLLSASAPGAKQDVLQALTTKVAGYGKTAKPPTGPALATVLATPESPAVHIGGQAYAQVDAQWAGIAARADRHFTYQRDAGDLGGVHPKQLYRDADGDEWLFKPISKAGDAFLADADEMTYRLARLLDPHAVEVRAVTLGGRRGTLQRMQAGLQAQKDYDGLDPVAIPPGEVAQLLQHHVVDWLLSNHDAHSGNFLRLVDGTVVAIDRAQAYKYFGKDRLALDYNPNATAEHPTTWYNAIFGLVKRKQLAVDPRHTLAAIERLEAIDDDAFLALLRPYAEGRPGDTAAFLQAALARKHSLRTDFEAFYQDVLGDKGFRFTRVAEVPRKPSVLPKHLEEAVSEAVERASWQGVTIPFDTDLVEDLQLHLCTERVGGTKGKPDLRTVYRLKMRPDRQARVLEAIQAAQRGGTAPAPGQPLSEDTFYGRILEGVRTINAHLARGDRHFNAARLGPALACEPELRALLQSDRRELRDMAQHYLAILDELTVYQRGGSTPLGRVSQLERYAARAGHISPAKTGPGPGFRVTEGVVILDRRTIAEGQIALQGADLPPGQLFGGHGKLPKTGKQYTVTFDDGTVVRVRPFSTAAYDEHHIQPGQNYYAIAGDVEVIVPGKGTPEQIERTFAKLSQLGIPAEVAPPEYQEYLYLHQVAVANNLPATDAGYQELTRRLEARGAPISQRVEELVRFWNGRLKVKDIRRLPRYHPAGEYQFDAQGRRMGGTVGYRRTARFDLDVEKEMRGYNLMHQCVGEPASKYVEMVDLALTHNGSLLATTEKLRIGVQPGGMSPEADMASGGANYVFTRWRPDPRGAKSRREMGFYLKPGVAARTDTIVYATDHYGRCYGDFVTTHRETKPAAWRRIAEHQSNNETILKQNITLLDHLDCIVLDSAEAKRQMLGVFGKHGITHLPDGRTVEEAIVVIPGAKRSYS